MKGFVRSGPHRESKIQITIQVPSRYSRRDNYKAVYLATSGGDYQNGRRITMLLSGRVILLREGQYGQSPSGELTSDTKTQWSVEIQQGDDTTIYISTTDPRAPDVFKFGETVQIEIKEK